MIKRRGICMGLLQSGYPLGALLGGMISCVKESSSPIGEHCFCLEGASRALLLPLMIVRLPESLDFLSRSGASGADKSKERLLERFGLSELQHSMVEEVDQNLGSWKGCLAPSEVEEEHLLLWLCYFALMFSFYFVVSWTPKLLVDAGLSTSQGISAGAILRGWRTDWRVGYRAVR